MNQLTKGVKVEISNLKWYSKIDDDFNQKNGDLVSVSNNLKSLMLKKSICDAVIEVVKMSRKKVGSLQNIQRSYY